MDYWVYILACEKDRYYTGYTTHLIRRYRSHVSQTGRCKFTRSFKPLHLAQVWHITTSKSHALKLERFIKSLARKQKEMLIGEPKQLFNLFEKRNERQV